MDIDDAVHNVGVLKSQLASNMSLMRELNEMARNMMCNANRQSHEYILNIHRRVKRGQNDAALTAIRNEYRKAVEMCDDKVQLSIETYELVDRQIRILDGKLAALELTRKIRKERNSMFRNSLDDYERTKSEKPVENGVKNVVRFGTGNVPSASIFNKSLAKASRKKKVIKKSEVNNVGVDLLNIDMPIDPNEPIFCLCRQVSFGNMIMCDNTNCPIEWFHFECVNVEEKPKGAWFCPKCATKKQK